MAFMNALQSQMGSRVPQQGMPQQPPQMNPQQTPPPPPPPDWNNIRPQMQPPMYGGGFTGRGPQQMPQMGGPQSMGMDKGGGPPQMMAGQGGGMGPSPQMIQQMMMRRRMMGQPGQMNQQGPPIQGQ